MASKCQFAEEGGDDKKHEIYAFAYVIFPSLKWSDLDFLCHPCERLLCWSKLSPSSIKGKKTHVKML